MYIIRCYIAALWLGSFLCLQPSVSSFCLPSQQSTRHRQSFSWRHRSLTLRNAKRRRKKNNKDASKDNMTDKERALSALSKANTSRTKADAKSGLLPKTSRTGPKYQSKKPSNDRKDSGASNSTSFASILPPPLSESASGDGSGNDVLENGLSSWEEFLGSSSTESTEKSKEKSGRTSPASPSASYSAAGGSFDLPAIEDLFPVNVGEKSRQGKNNGEQTNGRRKSSTLDGVLPVADLFYRSTDPEPRAEAKVPGKIDKASMDAPVPKTGPKKSKKKQTRKLVRRGMEMLVGGVPIDADPPQRAIELIYKRMCNSTENDQWEKAIRINSREFGPLLHGPSIPKVSLESKGLFCEHFCRATTKWDICPDYLRPILKEHLLGTPRTEVNTREVLRKNPDTKTTDANVEADTSRQSLPKVDRAKEPKGFGSSVGKHKVSPSEEARAVKTVQLRQPPFVIVDAPSNAFANGTEESKLLQSLLAGVYRSQCETWKEDATVDVYLEEVESTYNEDEEETTIEMNVVFESRDILTEPKSTALENTIQSTIPELWRSGTFYSEFIKLTEESDAFPEEIRTALLRSLSLAAEEWEGLSEVGTVEFEIGVSRVDLVQGEDSEIFRSVLERGIADAMTGQLDEFGLSVTNVTVTDHDDGTSLVSAEIEMTALNDIPRLAFIEQEKKLRGNLAKAFSSGRVISALGREAKKEEKWPLDIRQQIADECRFEEQEVFDPSSGLGPASYKSKPYEPSKSSEPENTEGAPKATKRDLFLGGGNDGVFWDYSTTDKAPYGGKLGPRVLDAVTERAKQQQPRVIAIGDVHGCIDELQDLLRQCNYSPGDLVVFLGDLVCKGPDSISVVQMAREIGAIGVRGNHDFEVLRWYQAIRSGVDPPVVGSEHFHIASCLSPADLKWMHSLPWYISSKELDTLFVHAGFVSGIRLAKQNPRLMMNMRSILPDGTVTSKFFNNWPWARLWDGPQTVLFGHDADRGLQQYEHAVGLDTGCVYGGRLTACILPERRLVSVSARREYFKYRRKHYD